MNSYNNSQKILIIISIVIIITSTIFSFFLALPTFKIASIKNLFIEDPIKVFTSGQNINYNYNDVIKLIKGDSQISFNSNTLIFNDAALLRLNNSNELEIKKGIVYINAVNELSIISAKIKAKINKGTKVIFNTEEKIIIGISGKSEISPNKFLEANEQGLWQVDNFTISEFDRNILKEKYSPIISVLNNYKLLPKELTTFKTPVFLSLQPENGFITNDTSINLKGKVEIDSKVFINNDQVAVNNNGEFTKSINLNINENILDIVLIDKYDNKSSSKFTYNRSTSSKINNVVCNNENSSEQLKCLINLMRKNNGLKSLESNLNLSNVAYKHSIWMYSNTLSHIESDGSSFGERCFKSQLECKQEIILKNTSGRTEEIFQLLQNSNTYSKDLNNSFNTIAIGIYNNFVTILLN